jgi:hypothetical protein
MDVQGAVAWEALRPVVVIAGSGIWTEVLARLVFRSGGSAVQVTRPDDLFGDNVSLRPAVVVIGAPLAPAELIRITAMVRDRAPETAVLAALQEDAPGELAADLGVVGAVAVNVDEDLRQVTSCVGRLAGLRIRHSHRGILVAPVLLRSGHTLHAAIASDVSEGGLGIEAADPSLVRNVAEAQFHLPGMSEPITAAAEIAWIQDPVQGRVRAGLRFLDLDPIDRANIRNYKGGDGFETDGGEPLPV